METNKPLPVPKVASDFAIFEHQGQQFKVQVGDVIETAFDKTMETEKPVVFEKILVFNNQIGTPYLAGKKIHAKCLIKGEKGEKIIVFKYKAKKNYRVKTGFRKRFNQLRIEKLEG